jgi:hypothetical protein
MGLFDFFKPSPEATIQKHAARVANKRTQAPDRWDSIQALGALKSADAVKALLPRFTYYADPSITDDEEKEETFRLICAVGDAAIPPVRAFVLKAESLSWPLKILERVAAPEEVVEVLLNALAKMDVEYERDPQRKLQVLQALEEKKDPRISAAVERFLEDVNETARFHSVLTILKQDDADTHRDALAKALAKEESMRVKARLLEAFAARGWDVGAAKAEIAKVLPAGWSIDAKGVPQKR